MGPTPTNHLYAIINLTSDDFFLGTVFVDLDIRYGVTIDNSFKGLFQGNRAVPVLCLCISTYVIKLLR